MEYYSTIKKNEIMPFAAAWMDLEMIILSEISQTKINHIIISLICRIFLKIIQMNIFTKEKQTHRVREQFMVTGEGREGRVRLGVCDGHVHTAIFKIKCFSMKQKERERPGWSVNGLPGRKKG